MKSLVFDNNNSEFEFETSNFPSLLVELLYFQTNDTNWALRLASSSLQITFSCFDNSNKLLGRISQPLTPLVSPYQVQPYILFNHFPIRFDVNRLFINKQAISKYKVEIQLLGIQFDVNEKYNLQLHLLEHSNYQIFCNSTTIATVFITDNHPNSANQRNVTFIPVTTTTQSSSFKTLTFNNHENYLVSDNTTDDQILKDLFTLNKLSCDTNWTKVKL